MIKDILDNVSDDDIMYILNAAAFSADWSDKFETVRTSDSKFTNIDGSEATVSMMNGFAEYYMENRNCKGFAKMYKGDDYYFAALLPSGDIGSFAEKLNTEQGTTELITLLKYKEKYSAEIYMPKFSEKSDAELIPSLSSMGITSAFNPVKADFTGMVKSNEGNVFISRITQKNRINVTENGTRAASATLAIGSDRCAPDVKSVYLNRPFVYMIVDAATDIPVFIGAINSMS